MLTIGLGLSDELEAAVPHPCVAMIAAHFGIQDHGRPADKWLAEVCHWTWRVGAHPHISTELLMQLREAAEAEAIKIFGRNLHELLLAAPQVEGRARPRPRYPHRLQSGGGRCHRQTAGDGHYLPAPAAQHWRGSSVTLARMVAQHDVELISIGNGTASVRPTSSPPT